MRRENMAEAHAEWSHGFQERYRRLLTRAQTHRNAVFFGSLAILTVSLGLSPLLGSEFLPRLDEGNIWLTITLPPSASLERTKEVERQARAILRSYPEVGNIVTQVGRHDDGTEPKGPNNLEILADLKPRGSWRFSSKEDLVTDMSAKIHVLPGVPTNFSQVIQDNVEETLSGTKGEINVKVFGPDLEILESTVQTRYSAASAVRPTSPRCRSAANPNSTSRSTARGSRATASTWPMSTM
jgi:cobalt-zinc-cadmium resistance protein CzcA